MLAPSHLKHHKGRDVVLDVYIIRIMQSTRALASLLLDASCCRGQAAVRFPAGRQLKETASGRLPPHLVAFRRQAAGKEVASPACDFLAGRQPRETVSITAAGAPAVRDRPPPPSSTPPPAAPISTSPPRGEAGADKSPSLVDSSSGSAAISGQTPPLPGRRRRRTDTRPWDTIAPATSPRQADGQHRPLLTWCSSSPT